MRRREFLALAAIAAGWSPIAQAQSPQIRKVGFLGTASPAVWKEWVAAFEGRLRALGWTEGRTISIRYQWAAGDTTKYREIAEEFVRDKVDVIVTSGAGAFVIREVTTVIPIVFTVDIDPLASGLVQSLARPGRNMTGNSLQAADAAGKRIGLAREVMPNLRRLAAMGNVSYPATASELHQVEKACRELGLNTVRREVRRAEDIPQAFENLKGEVDAVYVAVEPLAISRRDEINGRALSLALPTFSGTRDFTAAGGLMAYGPNFSALFARSADLVDKILRGANAGEIPIEQPTKFDLVINLKTANALKLEVPTALLLRADEVIE
jgi:putative ABC transport system substrate-binding protein